MAAKFTRMQPDLLKDRIDATFYSPDFVANEERLKRSAVGVGRLNSLVKSGRRAVYFSTSTIENGSAPMEWVPFLTSDDWNANGFFIDINARRRVSPDFAARYPNGRLRANELLVKVKGPNQITAYNGCEPDRIVLVSGTIWGALVRREVVDPHYLVTALSSNYAATARSRLRTNLNVEFLSPADLLTLELPLPKSREVQSYIGDKVRQAERLRRLAWHESNLADAIVAGLMEQSITEADVLHRLIDNPGAERHDSAFEEELLKRCATTHQPDSNSRKHSRVSVSFLGDRLDARHYEQLFLDLKIRLRELNAVSLRGVSDKVECGPFGGNAIADELYEADGLPFLRPVNLSGNRFDSSDLVRVSEHRLRSQGLKIYSGENLYFARVGTPCVAMLRARASISPNVIVAQGNADAADVGYLYSFCKSHFGMMQLEQELKEGVQPTTSTDAVRNLQVVLPDKRIQKYVGDKCRRSEEFCDLSTRLTTAASALVDALIQGEVTESTLSSAEAARDRGDYMLDREVISGLIENRTDATRARPLFPDLDALYAAIDEAERAHTAGETS